VAKVTYVAADGARTTLDVEDGKSVMLAAVFANLKGIVGECGGMLTCATCHVLVDEPWASQLAPISEDEAAMLDFTAADRQPESRLSCQITMSAALDGLVVRMPERQT
jgi:ferredoxin, 2Fe-2S